MNAATAVITLIIAACLAYAVYNIIKARRNGGCGSCRPVQDVESAKSKKKRKTNSSEVQASLFIF